jgi:hypothetical protein
MSNRASRWRWICVSLLAFATARDGHAQTTLEYAHRVDSLAQVWRSAVASHAVDTGRATGLPANIIRVGPITVLADSQWTQLAGTVAGRLAPLATRAYGKLAEHLRGYQFVLRGKGGIEEETSVLSGIVDPAGRERWRGSDYA